MGFCAARTAESKVSSLKARKCRAFFSEMPASYQDNGKIPSAVVARTSCYQLRDEGTEYISGIPDDSPKQKRTTSGLQHPGGDCRLRS